MNGQLVDITDSVTQAIRYLSYAVGALCILNIVLLGYLHSIARKLKRRPKP